MPNIDLERVCLDANFDNSFCSFLSRCTRLTGSELQKDTCGLDGRLGSVISFLVSLLAAGSNIGEMI